MLRGDDDAHRCAQVTKLSIFPDEYVLFLTRYCDCPNFASGSIYARDCWTLVSSGIARQRFFVQVWSYCRVRL